jgi:hypothetical protein
LWEGQLADLEEPSFPVRPDPEFPPLQFPVVFADNIQSMATGPGFVKFYLSRIDPDIHGGGTTKTTVVCQVVMPAVGFAVASVFFQRQLDLMVKNNAIDPTMVQQMRDAYPK